MLVCKFELLAICAIFEISIEPVDRKNIAAPNAKNPDPSAPIMKYFSAASIDLARLCSAMSV